MKSLIDHVRRGIPRPESESGTSATGSRALDTPAVPVLERLNERAGQVGFGLQASPFGIMMVPVVDGKPLGDTELQALPAETREQLQSGRETLEEELKAAMKQIRELERAAKALGIDKQVALYVVGGLIDDLGADTRPAEVAKYVKAVRRTSSGIGRSGRLSTPGARAARASPPTPGRELPFRKYQSTSNRQRRWKARLSSSSSTCCNLFGRVEKEARFGASTASR
jgi:hypothetical protein